MAGDSASRRPGAANGPAPGELRVDIVDALGRPIRAGGLDRWLIRIAPRRLRGTVSIAIVRDAHVRYLNRTFRSIDSSTDVLSFPSDDLRGSGHLGDIVIARGVARRQAREAGHSDDTELRILALHGLLHLIGYDHEADNGTMRRVERRLRRKGGLTEGLIERVEHAPRGTSSRSRAATRQGPAASRGRRPDRLRGRR